MSIQPHLLIHPRNVLLNAVVVLVLERVVLVLLQGVSQASLISFCTTLLFATHPVHADSVAGIARCLMCGSMSQRTPQVLWAVLTCLPPCLADLPSSNTPLPSPSCAHRHISSVRASSHDIVSDLAQLPY